MPQTKESGVGGLSPKDRLSTERLSSIAKECNELKNSYERCFFEFFPRFLQGEKFKSDPCGEQLDTYRDCVRRHVESKMGIDLAELDGEKMSASEMAERAGIPSGKTKSNR